MKKPTKPIKPQEPRQPEKTILHDFKLFENNVLVEIDKCPPYWWALEENEELNQKWEANDGAFYDEFYEKYGEPCSGSEDIYLNPADIIAACQAKGCKDPNTIGVTVTDAKGRECQYAALEVEVFYTDLKSEKQVKQEQEEYQAKVKQYNKDLTQFKKDEKLYKQKMKDYRVWNKKQKLLKELKALDQ